MFNSVISAARRILSRSPSVQDPNSGNREATPGSHDINADMVTTRSGPVGARPTRNSKRVLEADDTSAKSKRRRTSGNEPIIDQTSHGLTPSKDPEDTVPPPSEHVEEQSQDQEGQSTIAEHPTDLGTIEAIPDTTKTSQSRNTPSKKKKLPVRARRSSPRVVIASSEARRVPHESQSMAADSNLPDEIPSSTYDSDNNLDSTQHSELEPSQASIPKSQEAHIRFGNEEPEELSAITMNQAGHERLGNEKFAQSQEVGGDEDNDNSDSDEAPEVVTTASAVSKAQAAQADAQRAFTAEKNKQDSKRKDRAARIAEEQQQKRKKEAIKAKQIAEREFQEADDEGSGEALPGLDINDLPDLLPTSLLDAVGDQRPPTPPPMLPGKSAEEKRKEKLNRHIKFLERGEKGIKDVKKGPVNVHVLARENRILAPKMNRDSRKIREGWLKGRQVEKNRSGKKRMEFGKVVRRPMGTRGFVADED